MRIAYVINSMEGGGASTAILPVAQFLMHHGCEVRVFALTPRDRRGQPPVEAAGIPVTVRAGGERDHIAALRWLRAQMRQFAPDLIWTSLTRATLLGQIVGQMRGVDVVSWQHNAFLKPANRMLLSLRQRRSMLWVADSASVAALTASRLGVEAARLAVWPLFAADAEAPQARPWQPGTPLRIGSLGRLHSAKGFDVLIAALARLRGSGVALPPVEVEIAGDGRLCEALETQAKQAGLTDFRLVGFAEPRRFLAGLHLYVQPSRAEGFCIAAHEAMQAGLPVLASAVGELPHTILPGVTGLTVPPGDVDALANALAALLADPMRLAEMGAAGRQKVLQCFGRESFAAQGTEVIGRLAALRAARSAATVDSAPRGSSRVLLLDRLRFAQGRAESGRDASLEMAGAEK